MNPWSRAGPVRRGSDTAPAEAGDWPRRLPPASKPWPSGVPMRPHAPPATLCAGRGRLGRAEATPRPPTPAAIMPRAPAAGRAGDGAPPAARRAGAGVRLAAGPARPGAARPRRPAGCSRSGPPSARRSGPGARRAGPRRRRCGRAAPPFPRRRTPRAPRRDRRAALRRPPLDHWRGPPHPAPSMAALRARGRCR